MPGRPVKKTNGFAPAAMSGPHSTPEEVSGVSSGGLKPSASLAADGRRIRIDVPSREVPDTALLISLRPSTLGVPGHCFRVPTWVDSTHETTAMMRTLLTALLLVFNSNTWAQQPTPLPTSEPGVQVRLEFLGAYNAKDVDAVVALYAEDATLVSDGGTFRGRNEIRNWVKAGIDLRGGKWQPPGLVR
jgi:hypothetical protein